MSSMQLDYSLSYLRVLARVCFSLLTSSKHPAELATLRVLGGHLETLDNVIDPRAHDSKSMLLCFRGRYLVQLQTGRFGRKPTLDRPTGFTQLDHDSQQLIASEAINDTHT